MSGATAQGGYRLMLRVHIAPALRELGFRRGPSPGAFRHETAIHAAEVRFRLGRELYLRRDAGRRAPPLIIGPGPRQIDPAVMVDMLVGCVTGRYWPGA